MPSLEKGFNSFIYYASRGFPAESPQYTGFYASSWKTSKTIPRPTETYQRLKGSSPISPWYEIGLKLRKNGTGSERPHVKPRFKVPSFKLSDTVYIANTAIYSKYALGKPVPMTTKHGGIIPFIGTLPIVAPEFFENGLKVTVRS